MATIAELGTVIMASAGFTWVCWKIINKEIVQKEIDYQSHVNNLYELYSFWKGIRNKTIPFSIHHILPCGDITYVAKSKYYTLYISETDTDCLYSLEHITKGIIMINQCQNAKGADKWVYQEVHQKLKHYNEYSFHHMFLENMRPYWELKKWKKDVTSIEDSAHLAFVSQIERIEDATIKEMLNQIITHYVQLILSPREIPQDIFKKYTQNIPQTIEVVLKEYLSLHSYRQQQLSSSLLKYLTHTCKKYQSIYEIYAF